MKKTQTYKASRALLDISKPRGKKANIERRYKVVVVGGKLVMREVK